MKLHRLRYETSEYTPVMVEASGFFEAVRLAGEFMNKRYGRNDLLVESAKLVARVDVRA